MPGFLEYVAGDSMLHRMNPVAKLFCAFLLSLAAFCAPNLWYELGLLALTLVLAQSCGMLRDSLRLARAVFFFSLLLALLQLLNTPSGRVLVKLPWGYIGTVSVLSAVQLIVCLVAASIPLFLVMYVTRLVDITNALVQILHVPYRYAFTFTSTVRFIPVFMNDMKGIIEAQTARGVEFDNVGLLKKLRLTVPLCVPLLVSSVRKTSSSAIAAEVRGFNLRTRQSGFKQYPLKGRDWLAMLLCALILGLCFVRFST